MGMDCKYCGAYIAGNADRCPACGKRIRNADREQEQDAYSAYVNGAAAREQQREEAEEQQEENRAYTYKDQFRERYGEDGGGGDRSASYTGRATPRTARGGYTYGDDDVRLNKSICYLCYFGPLFLIPYLTRPNSDFVKFHSNQGLLLLLASVVSGFLDIIPILGGLASFVVNIFVLVCFIKGLRNVSMGLKAPLPVIGELSILK